MRTLILSCIILLAFTLLSVAVKVFQAHYFSSVRIQNDNSDQLRLSLDHNIPPEGWCLWLWRRHLLKLLGYRLYPIFQKISKVALQPNTIEKKYVRKYLHLVLFLSSLSSDYCAIRLDLSGTTSTLLTYWVTVRAAREVLSVITTCDSNKPKTFPILTSFSFWIYLNLLD